MLRRHHQPAKTLRPTERPAAARVPGATYRLQLNQEFPFSSATKLASYLHDLGITDCYASPLFHAGPESTHGYDICGFDKLNPQLGSSTEFDRFATRLQQLGLGLILDMVPNHMGNDLSNRWWLDVLEHGQSSCYASWFDIDWRPLKSDLHDKVLLPILEDHYSRVLEAGKLKLVFEAGRFSIAYYNRKFPLALACYAHILQRFLEKWCRDARVSSHITEHLTALLEGLNRVDLVSVSQRNELLKIKEQLAQWQSSSTEFREALAVALEEFNGQPGEPSSFNLLHELLHLQHYRLAFWRVGPEEINYRRFFDITSLVSLRMELPEVFEATHKLLFCLLQDQKITGLRIDHPDGLWDPREYCLRLQARFARLILGAERHDDELSNAQQTSSLKAQLPSAHNPRDAPVDIETMPSPSRLYLVVEKILTGEEQLPEDWPVAGTTGYDFLNCLNGIFINPAHESAFDEIYREFTGIHQGFQEWAYAGKKHILQYSLISELRALAHRLKRVAVSTRYGQDFSFGQLHAALSEIIACFPVYRTYVTADSQTISARDSHYVSLALASARARNPAIDSALFDFIQSILQLDFPRDMSRTQDAREFVLKFQQLTGPVTAKGVEDTALYNYNRLVSLNEVGGDSGKFGTTMVEFHNFNRAHAQHWPNSLLATATHDTKRGEDFRARLNLLSEMPTAWRETVKLWGALNRCHKSLVDGQLAPCSNDEYLLYQTLLGAWLPESENAAGLSTLRDRVSAYMLKAIKESKTHTSWTAPHPEYESALKNFVEKILELSSPFLAHFQGFQKTVSFFGVFNSLSQVLLKMTSPGVPDFYQGTELWDFNLVDPDNRRPVNYQLRERLLYELKAKFGCESVARSSFLTKLLQTPESGQVKMFLIWQVLALRKSHSELFECGNYLPLKISGPKKDHICSFARILRDEAAITLAPRLNFGLTGGSKTVPVGASLWKDTTVHLPAGFMHKSLRNVLTGELVHCATLASEQLLQVSEALTTFPGAVLVSRLG